MSKTCKRFTESEFRALPIVLNAREAAQSLGVNDRYLMRHPDEFGGKKIAGKWAFPKRTIAAILGIEL